MNYLTNLPAIDVTAELMETLRVGESIPYKAVMENHGRTAARGLDTDLRFTISPASQPFKPEFPEIDSFGQHRPVSPTLDLQPGARTTLEAVSAPHPAHQHDVDALTSGTQVLYVYGRSTYRDIDDIPYELHFCRRFLPNMKSEPLKLSLCESFNETIPAGPPPGFFRRLFR